MLSSVTTLVKIRGGTEKGKPPTAIHRGPSLSKALAKKFGMIHERHINTAPCGVPMESLFDEQRDLAFETDDDEREGEPPPISREDPT